MRGASSSPGVMPNQCASLRQLLRWRCDRLQVDFQAGFCLSDKTGAKLIEMADSRTPLMTKLRKRWVGFGRNLVRVCLRWLRLRRCYSCSCGIPGVRFAGRRSAMLRSLVGELDKAWSSACLCSSWAFRAG